MYCQYNVKKDAKHSAAYNFFTGPYFIFVTLPMHSASIMPKLHYRSIRLGINSEYVRHAHSIFLVSFLLRRGPN